MNTKNINKEKLFSIIKGFKDRKLDIDILKRNNYIDPIEAFKKGHKIHIKEKNKGKFTEYCGGNVTLECIRRGKNSSSSTIRKRATFAANSRKWNH